MDKSFGLVRFTGWKHILCLHILLVLRACICNILLMTINSRVLEFIQELYNSRNNFFLTLFDYNNVCYNHHTEYYTKSQKISLTQFWSVKLWFCIAFDAALLTVHVHILIISYNTAELLFISNTRTYTFTYICHPENSI